LYVGLVVFRRHSPLTRPLTEALVFCKSRVKPNLVADKSSSKINSQDNPPPFRRPHSAPFLFGDSAGNFPLISLLPDLDRRFSPTANPWRTPLLQKSFFPERTRRTFCPPDFFSPQVPKALQIPIIFLMGVFLVNFPGCAPRSRAGLYLTPLPLDDYVFFDPFNEIAFFRPSDLLRTTPQASCCFNFSR